MQLSNKTRLQLKIQKFIFLFLFITTIGLLAWLSNHYSAQFDLTTNQRHSLSQNSIDLLDQLSSEITLHAYVSDADTRKAVTEIIRRFQHVKKDFQLKFFNPDIDFEQAAADGVELQNNIAFVIHYKNRHENISSLGEGTISNALLRLSKRDQQTIAFLSGHGERDPLADTNRSYATLKQTLESRGFNIDVINLLVTPLSSKINILVIAAPEKTLLDGEVSQIESYLDNGGNLLWLTDLGKLQGLSGIAESLGIHFQPGVIVDNNTNLRETLNIQHPAIIPVIEYPRNVITQRLNYTLFPIARGLEILDSNRGGWTISPLLQSLPRSWTETGSILDEIVFASKDGDIAGPITLGLALERKKASADNALSNSHSQRIIVIGDSDFLANTHIGAGDNLALGIRLFNWLSNDDKLLTIAPKPAYDLKLELDDTQLAIIGFGFFLILPLLLLISGLTIWYRRKKR